MFGFKKKYALVKYDIYDTLNDYKLNGKNKKDISPSKRLSGSLAFAIHANMCGVQILRTHDVFETNQALICQKHLYL